VSSGAGQGNARWIQHRVMAHQMRGRGQSVDLIAEYLRVSKRSVARYLAAPCPEPVTPVGEVRLDSFFTAGACGSFPELNWMSRSTREQAECKAICEHCAVLAQCRDYGLGKGRDEAGVWGGMTVVERRREIQRGRTAAGSRRRRRVRAGSDEPGVA
jgi:WhiB family transcriptional regulator, redox-sensing transcriptional regulator